MFDYFVVTYITNDAVFFQTICDVTLSSAMQSAQLELSQIPKTLVMNVQACTIPTFEVVAPALVPESTRLGHTGYNIRDHLMKGGSLYANHFDKEYLITSDIFEERLFIPQENDEPVEIVGSCTITLTGEHPRTTQFDWEEIDFGHAIDNLLARFFEFCARNDYEASSNVQR
jgi:hypothetical protein